MLTALTEHYSSLDALIMAAAVADFSVERAADQKIKRGEHALDLRLVPESRSAGGDGPAVDR